MLWQRFRSEDIEYYQSNCDNPNHNIFGKANMQKRCLSFFSLRSQTFNSTPQERMYLLNAEQTSQEEEKSPNIKVKIDEIIVPYSKLQLLESLLIKSIRKRPCYPDKIEENYALFLQCCSHIIYFS